MPSTVHSPGHSFVRFKAGKYLHRNNHCYPDVKNTCLPVYDIKDLAFQIVLNLDAPQSGARFFVCAVPVNDQTDEYCEDLPRQIPPVGINNKYYNCSNPLPGTIPPPMPYNELLWLDPHPTLPSPPYYNLYADSSNWVGSLGAGLIDIGQCFRLIVIQSDLHQSQERKDCTERSYIIGCSNCFVRVAEQCDTSVLKYKCRENQFGFTYVPEFYDDVATKGANLSFINQIRLPLYLGNPQFITEESSYQKSDGTFIKLHSRIVQEYELFTDYMPIEWHERLKIALEHDFVEIYNTNIIQSVIIVSSAAYDIEWPKDIRVQEAMAKTKVKVSIAADYVNSNCA